MRIVFNILEPQQFIKLFKFPSDYIDLSVKKGNKDKVFLIQTNSLMYCHLKLDVTVMEEVDRDTTIRIPKKIFLKLIKKGTVSVSTTYQGTTFLEFKRVDSEGITITQEILLQHSNLSEIQDYWDILKEIKNYPKIKLNTFKKHLPLLRSCTDVVSNRDNVLSSETKDGWILIRNECSSFNLFTNHLKQLLDFCESFTKVQNYIVGVSEGLVIICHQTKATKESPQDYVFKSKTQDQIIVDLSDVCKISTDLDITESIELNLLTNKAKLYLKTSELTVDIKTKEITNKKNKSEDSESISKDDILDIDSLLDTVTESKVRFPNLLLSGFLVTKVLSKINRSRLILRLKKLYLLLETRDVTVIVSREERKFDH